jgi:phospholipid/cholesterol/gamma-HCH transport system substrate-binding protein
MDDSAAIIEGAPVRLNGILIGKTARIVLTGSTEPRRIVRIDMEVDHDKLSQIPVDSQAQIAAENLLGTKYINITKGRAPETIKPGAEIASLDTREFQDVVNAAYPAMASIQSILKRVDAIVSQIEVGKGTIGKLLVDETLYNKFRDIANETHKLTVALNSDKGTIGKLIYTDELHSDIRGSLARINTLLDGLEQGQGTAGRLLKDPSLYDDTRKGINEIRAVITDVQAGKGTVGKLLKSDEMHNQILATIKRMDGLVDKIEAGQGTLGQLFVNPSLYESLNGATREVEGLMKDFRANPKKFLRIKLGLF